MPWGAAIGALGSVAAAKIGSKDKNGGAGTSTQSKDPWDKAQPWLEALLDRGSNLSQQYAANPFNEQQQQAFANSYGLSDYARELVPSLLSQMSGQPLGYDPKNPDLKAKAWDWSSGMGNLGGASGAGGGSMASAAARQGAADAATKSAAAKPGGVGWDGQFRSQDEVLSGLNTVGNDRSGNLLGTGGFGSWQYGGGAVPGTDQWRDMQEYFLRGGADPNNVRAGFQQAQFPAAAFFQNAGGS